MARVRYTPPTAAELKALAGLGPVHDAMDEAAERGAQHARSIAPVDSGDYRSKFGVKHSRRGQGPAVALIVNDDPGAMAIEHGTSDTPPHNVLSKTADWLEGGA